MFKQETKGRAAVGTRAFSICGCVLGAHSPFYYAPTALSLSSPHPTPHCAPRCFVCCTASLRLWLARTPGGLALWATPPWEERPWPCLVAWPQCARSPERSHPNRATSTSNSSPKKRVRTLDFFVVLASCMPWMAKGAGATSGGEAAAARRRRRVLPGRLSVPPCSRLPIKLLFSCSPFSQQQPTPAQPTKNTHPKRRTCRQRSCC